MGLGGFMVLLFHRAWILWTMVEIWQLRRRGRKRSDITDTIRNKVNKDPGYDNHAQMSRQDPSGEAHHELEMLVHDAYAICARSFASCKTCPPLSPESLQLVEDEASRFDVWAANTGSCRDPSLSSSLDHRLRNSPSTREMVVLLLRAVRVNLDYGMRITSL